MHALLVIADDQALRESLRVSLSDSNLVLFERSVDDALRRLIAIRTDLVIVDDAAAASPNALAKLKATLPKLPIVVLANRGDSGTLAHFILQGARECVVKPFQCDDLVQTVERVLSGNGSAGMLQRVNPQEPISTFELVRPTYSTSGGGALSQYQIAMRWLSRATGLIRNPDRLSECLVESMVDTFGTVRCAILMERDGMVRIAASHGLQKAVRDDLRFGFMSGLMRWFEENQVMFDRLAVRDAAEAVREMHLTGARLGVPLLSEGRVCGALLVGEKASGAEFSTEERELLISFGRCASIAVENSLLYVESNRQQQRLDAVLCNITAGFVLVAPNRTVAMLNQSAEQILQLRAVDVVGRSVQRLGSAFADVVLRALSSGKPLLRQEIVDPAIDSHLGVSATPVGNEGVAVVFSRIPDQAVNAEEVAYSPFWEYLSSRVAQEIKNPMVAVNTFAQLLPRKYESPDFREAFGEVVQKEVARINKVVETLFDFARHPRLVLQRTSVSSTVRSVLESFEREIAERSIELVTDLAPDTVEAPLDGAHFAQALHNVVQNSIEAMPKGGKLHIATRPKGDRCEIVVSDTGAGVADKDSNLIFLPFFSTKEQGMGLGLTLAERILKQHNGDLKLVEKPEAGSMFAMSVPTASGGDADNSSR